MARACLSAARPLACSIAADELVRRHLRSMLNEMHSWAKTPHNNGENLNMHDHMNCNVIYIYVYIYADRDIYIERDLR